MQSATTNVIAATSLYTGTAMASRFPNMWFMPLPPEKKELKKQFGGYLAEAERKPVLPETLLEPEFIEAVRIVGVDVRDGEEVACVMRGEAAAMRIKTADAKETAVPDAHLIRVDFEGEFEKPVVNRAAIESAGDVAEDFGGVTRLKMNAEIHQDWPNADPIAGDFTIKACPTNTGKYYEKGWHRGTGRVNIADLDGDGKLNLAYVSGKFLYALKEDMTLFWKVEVNEETSGNTGCTLFDFNGDGQSEIVYRDEKFVYIINGTNGSVFTQQPCVSRTNREYPIVADVDADGNTELCVTCRYVDFVQNGTITDPNDANYLKADEDNFCEIKNSEFSHVRVFRSGGEPWVPARRVWNQHGYFNVNVNDNLTIPKVQQKHHIVFSENVCTTGKNRPLNSFLNQSPFFKFSGVS